MKVKDLINFLNTIENKEQEVFATNFDFSNSWKIEDIIEIKSSSNTMYPIGVNLIGDL